MRASVILAICGANATQDKDAQSLDRPTESGPGIRWLTTTLASVRHRRRPETFRLNDDSEHETGRKLHGKTINKHIRVDVNHWRRIEKAAHERGITPVRLVISVALQSDRRTGMASNPSGNLLPAIGDVHRTGHHPRHGQGRTRRGNLANQQEYLRSRAGIAGQLGEEPVKIRQIRRVVIRKLNY